MLFLFVSIFLASHTTPFLASAVDSRESFNFSVTVSNTPLIELRLSQSSVNIDVTPQISAAGFSTTNTPLTVTAGTTGAAGYTLAMTTDDTALTRTEALTDGTKPKILSLTEDATNFPDGYVCDSSECNFTENSWGYKLANTNYLPMKSAINLKSTTNEGADTVDIDFASRVNFRQEAGTYDTTINFVAIANPVAYIQNLPAASCTTNPLDVYDIRDYEKYTIQRLADGKCWMLDNLRLGGSSAINLSSYDTNTNPNLNNGYFTLPASISSNFSSLYDPQINTSNKNTEDINGWQYGTYYNYAAASAGTVTGENNTRNASYDICPAGWRMPSQSEFSGMITTIGSNVASFMPVYAGRYYEDASHQTEENGYLWASTFYDSTRQRAVHYNSGNLIDYYYDRQYGYSIRCVMKGESINDIQYMQDITAINSTAIKNSMTEDTQYQLKDKRDEKPYWVAKLKDGKIWMTQGLDLDLSSSTPLTSLDTDLNEYAVNGTTYDGYAYNNGVISWTPANSTEDSSTKIITVQTTSSSASSSNFTTNWNTDGNDVPHSANPGDKYVLPTQATSANKTKNTSPFYTNYWDLQDTYYNNLAACNSATNSYTGTDCTHYQLGNFYNFAAATATNSVAATVGHTIADTDNYTDMPNSICPANWRLPHGLLAASTNGNASASNSEFDTLLYAYGAAANIGATAGQSIGYVASNGVNTGLNIMRTAPLYFTRPGDVSGSTLYGAGVRGTSWSSTISNMSRGYDLAFDSPDVYPADSDYRYRGFTVRCIAR